MTPCSYASIASLTSSLGPKNERTLIDERTGNMVPSKRGKSTFDGTKNGQLTKPCDSNTGITAAAFRELDLPRLIAATRSHESSM